ncbi:hypothetical protein B9479_006142 [Cryptococcus floricola]|uniref:Uncharacterized protein n=1 Tax=Cryptococcus floricola TaxID=2591691 RepID=A0A5D3ASL5_9TREE|nr:hypothetical protein B9479_006142 [Cryptococcus floricola]
MSDTTLSPRLRHLLIKDDNAPIASLPPIRAYPSPTRPRFSTRPSSGIKLPPVSPTSDGLGWSASDSPPSSHSQQRPSTSPSTPSHLILPHPNRRSNSIMALLNSQPPSPTPSSNNSSAGSVIRAGPEWQRASLSYPRRPPSATFPTIEQSSSAAYFDEPPSLPPTPGSYYQSMSADGSSDERPTIYRRHSSHPYERYDRYVYAPPYHPSVHRHSTPHHTLPPATSLMSPPTARPSVSKSRRSSSQSHQSRSQARGSVSSQPQPSPIASHRSSVASSRSIQDVVTPEDTQWSHTPHGYGFPFPAASNGVQVQGYDWHAANSGAGSDKMPPAWTGAQVGPRGSYSATPWDERRWSAEGGVRGYP